MAKVDELTQGIANRWDAMAAMLGADRERIEYELLGLLRQLELARSSESEAVVQAILALFKPFAAAFQMLMQAVRDADPTRAKGAGRPAGFSAMSRYTKFPVFYGTDRSRSEIGGTPVDFSGDRGELSYGVAEVSIPDDPRMGKLARPCWWKLQFHTDPAKHVMVHSVQPLAENDFINGARATLDGTPKKEVLVFVHGFCVGFQDAVVRAAQFAYDLHFEGLAALYSWPSEGSVARYTVDEGNVAWSRPRFSKFLALIRERLGADTVHVVAHSMGNRLLVDTLASMVQPAADGIAALNQVVFAAPDVDGATFKDFADGLRHKAERFTLYASSDDLALKASKAIHKYSRAGESGLDLVVSEAVDTIDATAVDTSLLGHSYYAENRSLLSDLFYLIRNRTPPDERFGLVAKDRHGLRYWSFKS